MKLLEQPIPASFLLLEERVRVLAMRLKQEAEPPLLKENRFRDETSDIIANPRQLDQAVTFLHENGEKNASFSYLLFHFVSSGVCSCRRVWNIVYIHVLGCVGRVGLP